MTSLDIVNALVGELSSKLGVQPPNNDSPQSADRNSVRDILEPEDRYNGVPEHSRGEPLIEVCSIRIFKKSFLSNQDEECQIYGDIWVDDLSGGKRCTLYERSLEDHVLDIISFGNSNLKLTGAHESVISMIEPVIFVDIRDKATGAPIVKGSSRMFHATTDIFEREDTLTIYSHLGTADVDYIALRFGIAAVVDVYPRWTDTKYNPNSNCDFNPEDENIQLYGTITAHYKHAYCGRRAFLSTEKSLYTTVLDRPAIESEGLVHEVSLNLCRSVVAVPAYSSLVLDLDLKDSATDDGDTPIILDQVVAFTFGEGATVIFRDCQSYPKLQMCVCVKWELSFTLDKASYDRESIGSSWCKILTDNRMLSGAPLLEIFSMIIVRPHDVELRLYGSIYVYGVLPAYEIFTATKMDPFILPSGCNSLPIRFPPGTMAASRAKFYILVDLSDVNDQIYIEGYGHSSHGMNSHHGSWFDRRLCSVFKDASGNGFAAIQYTVMTCGVECALKVSFLSKEMPLSSLGLYGEIVATYSKFEYTTEDDKKYCRCILFERSEGSCLTPLEQNMEVQLSRPVVPVPFDSVFLVEVDLKLLSAGSTECAQSTIEFIPGEDTSYVLDGSNFAIKFFLEWRDVHG